MKFVKTAVSKTIDQLRSRYYQKLTAPIDAMWELLYIATAQHYLIVDIEKTIGYCCISSEGCLVQLFLDDPYRVKMQTVLETLIDENLISTAQLSSNEPISFNSSLSLSKSIEVHTYCFEHPNTKLDIDTKLNLDLVSEGDIPEIKSFLKEQLGMDDTFGYTENLVSRGEIFMLKESGEMMAISECRLSDSQSGIADIGIIVHRKFQGMGIANQVFKIQVNRVLDLNRRPICSTTLANVAARKVIENAGFYCSNIIFNMILSD